jgi:hypothetical protein
LVSPESVDEAERHNPAGQLRSATDASNSGSHRQVKSLAGVTN